MMAVSGVSLIFSLIKDTASFIAVNIVLYLFIKFFFIVVEEMHIDANRMECRLLHVVPVDPVP